jgi:DNA-directed RNA polymerases I, II, and III subunit RPABC3
LIVVGVLTSGLLCDLTGPQVSRLHAHSKNYDMDLTLDFNFELFPLQNEQSFALALASSLVRGGAATTGSGGDGAEDAEDKDRHVWRPNGTSRPGLEDDYDYVMYGKVSSIDQTSTLKIFMVVPGL